MLMIVADTSVWIDYFNGNEGEHVQVLDYELLHNRIVIGDLIIAELLQGFRDEKQYRIVKKLICELQYYDLCGTEIAYRTADNYRLLRRKGITIRKTIDMIIGTFCIENRFELIHNDRDFDPIEQYLGLKVKSKLG
jgi:Predicted nucleic acid-binding protein, contains PIN domain